MMHASLGEVVRGPMSLFACVAVFHFFPFFFFSFFVNSIAKLIQEIIPCPCK